MSSYINIDNKNFDAEVTNSDIPVLIDFWAPWCGPCKTIGPVVEQLGEEYAGRVKVGKINVDQNQELAARFGVRGIPTIMVIKDGEVTANYVGIKPKQELVTALDTVLN